MSDDQHSPLSARYAHDGWPPYERHYTLNLVPFSEVVDSLDLSGKTVIEVGVGGGNITQLLLNRPKGSGGPDKVIGYEIDPCVTPKLNDPRLELRIGDFCTADLTEFQGRDDVVLISNPPYMLFPYINDTISTCGIKQVVLMASGEDALEHFQGYDIYAQHSGRDFMPIAEGNHYIIGKGLDTLAYREPEIPPTHIVPAHSRVQGTSMPINPIARG
ncbi:MAG: hypothetical protein ACKVOE_08415 [Rickettsiales bacterium]